MHVLPAFDDSYQDGDETIETEKERDEGAHSQISTGDTSSKKELHTITSVGTAIAVDNGTQQFKAVASTPLDNPFIAEGEVLHFDRVSRRDMGFYICIASNGVPPSVSQRIFLPVSC